MCLHWGKPTHAEPPKIIKGLLPYLVHNQVSNEQANNNKTKPGKAIPLFTELKNAGILRGQDDILEKSPTFLVYAIKDFVRYGSISMIEQYGRANAFNRTQLDKEILDFQKSLQEKTFEFEISSQLISVDADEVETRGLRVWVNLPFRITIRDGEVFKPTGLLVDKPRPFDANMAYTNYYYLTKDAKLKHAGIRLRREADELRKLNAVIYLKENERSNLCLNLNNNPATLKEFVRNAKDYSIKMKITGLSYSRPETWGFYKESIIRDFEYDCEEIRERPLVSSDQPNYFITMAGDEVNAKIPVAKLVSLSIVNNTNGKVAGAYGAE